MRKIAILSALLSCHLIISAQATWTVKASVAPQKMEWTSRTSLSGSARVAATGFALNGYGYVVGGTNVSSEFNDLYQYNPQTNSWSQKTSMPIAGMREPASFVIDTVAFVGLGFRSGANSHLSSFYRYSSTLNQWSAVAAFPEGRRAASGFTIDSLGYIIGGFDYGKTPDNSLYSYSAKTNSWTKRATMPGNGRSYPVCAVVDGKAYVMGGMEANGTTLLKDFYRYNPAGNSWSTLTAFPGGVRKGASALVIGHIIYIGNGKDNSTHLSDWWGYDTRGNFWFKAPTFPGSYQYGNVCFTINGKGYLTTGAYNSTVTNMLYEFSPKPTVLVAAVGFAVSGKGYVFGGTDLSMEYSHLYQYNADSNTWTQKNSMPVQGMREPAAFVIGNMAYAGLGFRSGETQHLSSMYKYNPGTDQWTPIASFPEGRRAAAGFAIDSLGYIIGGFQYGTSPDNSLYSYSPTLNKWTQRASIPGSARSYPACAVVKGKAYIMGGMLSNGTTYVNDFYRYNPDSNSWTQLSSFPGAARKGASVLVFGDTIYIGNGKEDTDYFRDWWGYNTKTNQWFSFSNFPSHSTYGNAFFTIGNKGYLATGAYNTTLMDSTFELSWKTLNTNDNPNAAKPEMYHIAFSNQLVIHADKNGPGFITVYDQGGRKLQVIECQISAGRNDIAISDLPQGIYFINLWHDGQLIGLKAAF